MPSQPQTPGFDAAGLKLRRLHRGLSRPEVARACGVTESSVGAWERGERTPSRKALVKLARLLRCEPADLKRPVRLS